MDNQLLIYCVSAFVLGFLIAWIIQMISIQKIKKDFKSAQGFLESEKLKKETLQKENKQVHQQKESVEQMLAQQLKESQGIIKMMDEDILLLQKSNEETEELLKKQNPELHELKLRLIEAQNTISRMKGAEARRK